MICSKESESGLLVSRRTFNRHRKIQQEFLENDDVEDIQQENIHQQQEDVYQQQQEDVHQQQQEDVHQQQQEDVHQQQQEDVHQQQQVDVHQQQQVDVHQQQQVDMYQQHVDNLNIIDKDSDAESFNFNEEDNEYYSDYYNEEQNDNIMDEDKDNDDDDKDEDSDGDDMDEDSDGDNMDDDNDENEDDGNEEDEDIMQIDNESNIPNKGIIEGLKLLHLKSLYNFTESAYEDIMKIFTTNNISLYKIKKYLKEITELVPVFYDMCENSCICYTGQYESYQNCPICHSIRLDTKGKAKKVMPYLPIISRLKMQFNNENRAKELLYRYEYITNKDDNDLDDIFDGEIYKELVNEGFFNDKRDIAFTASCDGYQIFKQKTDDCWLFLMINNNLDPSIRVKKENLFVPFLIPGPNQPKDFNTFLQPFIDEMKVLERKYFNFYFLFLFFINRLTIFFYFRRNLLL
jgi:hypothetical protein